MGSNVEVAGWDDVKGRPIFIYKSGAKSIETQKSRKDKASRSAKGKASVDVTKRNNDKTIMTDSKIFESKSSHDDRKFLAKDLQKWSETKNGASMGVNDDGCYIAVRSSWTAERQDEYCRWAATSFGFRLQRADGGKLSYLKCSDKAGNDALVTLCRLRSSTEAKAASSSKRRWSYSDKEAERNPVDTGGFVSPSKKRGPRWLSGSSRAGYGKTQPAAAWVSPCFAVSKASPRRNMRAGTNKGSNDAASVSPCSDSFGLLQDQRPKKRQKEKVLSGRNLTSVIDLEYSERCGVEMITANDDKNESDGLADGSGTPIKVMHSTVESVPSTLRAESAVDTSQYGLLKRTVDEQKFELERLRNELRTSSEKHAAEIINQETLLKTSFAKDVERATALAKDENEAEVQRVKHNLNETHANIVKRLKSDFVASYSRKMIELRIVGEKQRQAEVERISGELNGAQVRVSEEMRDQKEHAEQQLQ